MVYIVKLDPAAQRQLRRLARDIHDRVLAAILALAENPRPHGCKRLVGRDEWRVKVGDWRVIYRIEDRVVTVSVVRVSHRSDAYR